MFIHLLKQCIHGRVGVRKVNIHSHRAAELWNCNKDMLHGLLLFLSILFAFCYLLVFSLEEPICKHMQGNCRTELKTKVDTIPQVYINDS